MKCDCIFPEVREKSRQRINPHYKLYACWSAMLSRCYNPKNKNFDDYGYRGIRVSKEWMDDFQKYLSDIGEKPNGMSLDRADNNGHYCRHNFKWSTPFQQNMNRRSFKKSNCLPIGIYAIGKGYQAQMTIKGATHHIAYSENLQEVISAHREFYFKTYGRYPSDS